MKRLREWLAVGLIAGFFLVFFVIGSWLLVDTARFLVVGTRIEGTVVDFEADSTDDGVSFYSIIRFRPGDGESIVFTSRFGRASPPDPGSTVEVVFLESDPRQAREVSAGGMWVLPVVFVGIGLSGPTLVWWRWRRERNA